MKHPLKQVRQSADERFIGGDRIAALRLYTLLLKQVPEDYQARLAVADLLVKLGHLDGAAATYQATAALCINGGQPLSAVVACRALEALSEQPDAAKYKEGVNDLLGQLVTIHSRGSDRLAEVGGRLNVQYSGLEVADRDLRKEIPTDKVIATAAATASDLSSVGQLPTKFPPVPIFSRLTAKTMLATISKMMVHRLPAKHVLIRAGERGTSLYLIASGRMRVLRDDDAGVQQEIATLGPNSVVGEMALITGSPRIATVEVTVPADVLEVGPDALAAIGAELDELAPVLDKMARNRWMRNLLDQSPLFRIFDAEQKQNLLRHCSAHDVPPNTVLVEEGSHAKGLYMLLRGDILVSRDFIPGKKPVSLRLQAGAVAGVESVLDDKPSETSVATTSPSTVLFLSRRAVERLVEALPEFADAVRSVADHRRRITMLPG